MNLILIINYNNKLLKDFQKIYTKENYKGLPIP